VAYGSNMTEVFAPVAPDTCGNPRVLKTPEPGVGITALSDCSINIAVKPWDGRARLRAPRPRKFTRPSLNSFRAHKIEIPFPPA